MTAGATLRLLLVVILSAACFPLITLGIDQAPHLAFAAMRGALAGACLLAVGAIFRRPIPRGLRSWTLVGIIGIGTTSLGFLGMFHAAEYVSPGLATVIANSQPLLAAVLAQAFLGERLVVLGKIGLLAGLIGIVMIAWPGLAADGREGYVVGIAYSALAAAGAAVGNTAMGRLAGKTDAIMTMGLQLLIGAVPLAIVSATTEDASSITWSGKFVVILFILAVFSTSLAYWLWFSVLRDVSLSRANAFTFLVPVLGLTVGVALFGEQLSWLQVAGIVAVLGGITLVQRSTRLLAGSSGTSQGRSRRTSSE